MNDEEKKAIEKLKNIVDYNGKIFHIYEEDFIKKYISTILNLIETQQKEIEILKEERKKYPIAMNDEQYKKVIELAQKDIKEELDRQIKAILKKYAKKEIEYAPCFYKEIQSLLKEE